MITTSELLTRWLLREFADCTEEQRATEHARMSALIATDPAYWGYQKYWRIYDMAHK